MNSKEYWRKREAENARKHIKEEKAYTKEVNRIYDNMLDECQKEIDSFYRKYAKSERISIAEAKKRVSQVDIAEYEKKAKRYVKDKDFSPKANAEMRLYNATMKINRLEMLKADIGKHLIAGHDELDKFMTEILQGRTEEELKRQAGILGKTIINNHKGVDAIVNGSFHNATFSERIWNYNALMKADMDKLLQRGLIQGVSSRELAKEMRKYYKGTKGRKGAAYSAETLMITELRRVQTEAARQSYDENGNDKYIFMAVNPEINSVICDECRKLDGQVFNVKDMKVGENAPPMHPRCHCTTAPYQDEKEFHEWLDFIDKGGTTEEWNNKAI